MADPAELIVEFHRGVAESEARLRVESVGGQVRRRMRSDHADLVTLLVRFAPEALDGAEQALDGAQGVLRTERNRGGFSAL
jgi:hypothetical protein